jgi:hypothetical protein
VIPSTTLGRCEILQCWVRRYRCQRCFKACSVLPTGVLLGFAYSVASMIAVWTGRARAPIGGGQTHAEVYARQGVDRLRPRHGRIFWKAPRRWAERHLIDSPGATWQQRVQAFLIGHALRGAPM